MSTEVITEGQSVSVSGEGHAVATVAGDMEGDIVLTSTVVQERETEFVPIPLERFEPPGFPSPRNISELVGVVRHHSLLVMGGSNEIAKDDLARHVAWYLSEELQDPDADDGSIPIVEWRRIPNPPSLGVTLRTKTNPTIFIIPQVEPQDVRYDLVSIQKAAVHGQHCVIISTDTPFASWKLDPGVKSTFWYELPDEDLWGSKDLANALIEALIDAKETLPPGLLGDDPEPGQPFVGNLLYQSIAERLRTPGNVAAFVRLLRAETEPLEEPIVLNLVERAQGDEHTLKQWYHTQLNPCEQLLALGLSLLDGLFDDQFFAALEFLVGQVWRQRDPSLRALDYNDLDNLGNFFKSFEPQTRFSDDGDSSSAYVPRIQVRSPELRRRLLRVAWQSHRRRILATLPVLARLASHSAANRSLNAELYGNRVRRSQLQRALGRTLSEVGLISVHAVEDTLIQLAVDEETAVQAVAASAMAQWREHGRDEELFETLQRWQLETRIYALVEAILEEREEETQSVGPLDYVRATVALTVSYAAQYDRPNELSQGLYDLLQDLSHDPSSLVRGRFCSHTLFWVVPPHLAQLRDFLHDLTIQQVTFIPSISASLARAYTEDADEVLSTLDQWTREHEGQKAKSKNRITLREALRATVALTYGHIRYDERIGSLTVGEAFERLRNILAEEEHPFVRKAAIAAVSLQARRNFGQVATLLPALLEEVTRKERNEIVQVLTGIYLKQRQQLEGGDDTIEIDDKSYPIWLDSDRPLTAIEEATFRWIKDPVYTMAQQIATQASVAFAKKLEQPEERAIDARRSDRRTQARVEPVEFSPLISSGTRGASLLNKLAARIATTGAADYYPIVCGLLPEALAQNLTNRAAMRSVLDKWRDSPDNEVEIIAARLGRAITVSGRLLGCGCLLLILMGIIIAIVMGALTI